MSGDLRGRSLITLCDFSREEIRYLLDLSHKVKKEKHSRKERFKGLTLALLFEKRSTRTRCAFETAFGEEGGHPVFLSSADIQLGSKESIEDTARVLGRMFDCIQFRGFKTSNAQALAEYSGVPVYNGLTDDYHPTQILADLMTIEESKSKLEGIKVVYAGDGRNNVANSLMIGCSIMGTDITIASPHSLLPSERIVTMARNFSEKSGSLVEITTDIQKAVIDADVIYTDVWASMGEEDKLGERIKLLKPYQVNSSLMEKTGKGDTIFMHCLPAVKGNEVTAEVIDGSSSEAWNQAENRKHTIKAVMLATLGLE
ncbi:MAG: ornithine carbamoyltransferase [Spirochaetia bacterium]|jgi:ornithine carbamoyltransferase|nr:ornithine carbamoyltransferase [Spirochaetia bacterium]